MEKHNSHNMVICNRCKGKLIDYVTTIALHIIEFHYQEAEGTLIAQACDSITGNSLERLNKLDPKRLAELLKIADIERR